MYISQTKSKNGINIVDSENRFFVSWIDLEKLKAGTYLSQNNKPIIVLIAFPEKA